MPPRLTDVAFFLTCLVSGKAYKVKSESHKTAVTTFDKDGKSKAVVPMVNLNVPRYKTK